MDLIYTLDQTDEIAAQLVTQFGTQTVWVFQAPMGAGKTTLIAAIGNPRSNVKPYIFYHE
jgi:tRNA threonylcarbamoyladenosine biosynthesis protein TsaE